MTYILSALILPLIGGYGQSHEISTTRQILTFISSFNFERSNAKKELKDQLRLYIFNCRREGVGSVQASTGFNLFL